MSLLDRIAERVGEMDFVQDLANDQREQTIQELPLQGKLWYYLPGDEEAGTRAEYGLTYDGWRAAAVVLGVFLAVNVFSRRR
ncbi:MAG: hypothetical protein AAF429_14450 [Pseudomonadota bacterium]